MITSPFAVGDRVEQTLEGHTFLNNSDAPKPQRGTVSKIGPSNLDEGEMITVMLDEPVVAPNGQTFPEATIYSWMIGSWRLCGREI
jgi:hypothetical protein